MKWYHLILDYLFIHFGYLAAFLTTFSFLPQAIKIIKEKDTKSISLVIFNNDCRNNTFFSKFKFSIHTSIISINLKMVNLGSI